MSDSKRKRITMKLKTPNPLFEKWLTEWRDKARKENSKMEFCFNIALQSLKKYPVPLAKGRDCKILKGFGDKLCVMLDNKLKEHQRNGVDLDNTIIGNTQTFNEVNEPAKKKRKSKSPSEPGTLSKNKSRSKEYLPQERTGCYAILVTLYTQSLDPAYPGFLSKQEIITEGQHLSHTSFTKPDPGSRYTAWSSMGTLIKKNLVVKKSNPPKFSLSDEGIVLARKLFDKGKDSDENTSSNSNVINDVPNVVVYLDSSDGEAVPQLTESNFNFEQLKCQEKISRKATFSASQSTVSSISSESEKIFPLNENKSKTVAKFTSTSSVATSQSSVMSSESENGLYLTSKSKKAIGKHASSSSIASSTHSSSQEECFIFSPDSFDIILYVDTCETSGSSAPIQDDPILAELRHLETTYEIKNLKIGDYIWICRDRASKKELVLPYVVERKRMDDFGHSIKDGRYHEQKFRLKKSGIQNITYLIEKFGSNHVGLPLSTLYQAATNTAVQDGFCVKFTENIRDTARYLANFSKILVKMFQSKTLVSCPKDNLSEISLEDELISLLTFKEFNHSSTKNKPMKVSDLFVKMLIQIKGMSVDRALAIVEEYPTPALLKRAYDENPGDKGEKLLMSIQFGESNKCIGPILSKIVHQLFTLKSFS